MLALNQGMPGEHTETNSFLRVQMSLTHISNQEVCARTQNCDQFIHACHMHHISDMARNVHRQENDSHRIASASVDEAAASYTEDSAERAA
jgi:hypothetical protein